VVDVFCHNCGHRNPAGVNFCSSCGSVLVTASSDTTISVQPVEDTSEGVDDATAVGSLELPRGAGMLVVKRGPNTGVRYVLEDITVSRRHAEFLTRDQITSVRDVGSLNGTYVNRERIEEARLSSGDEVQIGKFKLLFLVAAGE